MNATLILNIALAILSLAVVFSTADETKKPFLPTTIIRLNGTKISTTDAEAFAKKTLEASHTTGAQIIVMDHGRIARSFAFGSRKRDPPLTMNVQTTTWAASITKSVFAVYVMKLVEQEDFNLDAPIAESLPQSLDSYAPYRDSAVDLVKDPAWLKVTPRMLLSHTSGLANFAFLEPDKKMHLHSQPGSKYRYSGEGINLLQFAIEQRKLRPLDQLMHETLFAPLGLTRTSIVYNLEFSANVADRYGVDERFHSETKKFPARAAGSMTTSAEDLSRIIEALFAGKILKPKSLKAMLESEIRISSIHQFSPEEDDIDGVEARNVGLGIWFGLGVADQN